MVGAATDQRSRFSALARGESAALLAAARSYGERAAQEASQESAEFAALLAAYREAPDETRGRLRRETLTAVLGAVRCLTAGEAARAAGDSNRIAGERQP
jgi:regulator of protease activity HflC (stomatin/prohibitin superfamily)